MFSKHGSNNDEKAGEDDMDVAVKDSDTAESVSTAVVEDKPPATEAAEEPSREPRAARRISFSVRGLLVTATIVGLIAAVGVMTWLYLGEKGTVDDLHRQAGDTAHAEQIAIDYAVNAALMDFKDLGPWKQKLVAGTTPELGEKLTKAANAMEQIILPLEWISTAKPIAAKVRTNENGIYIVDAFVSVMTKTVQAADSLQSTATYAVTIDSNNDWRISDVGGIAAVVGEK